MKIESMLFKIAALVGQAERADDRRNRAGGGPNGSEPAVRRAWRADERQKQNAKHESGQPGS